VIFTPQPRSQYSFQEYLNLTTSAIQVVLFTLQEYLNLTTSAIQVVLYGGPLPLTDIFRISKMLNVSNHQKVFSAKKAENQKVLLAEKSFLAENRNGILALPNRRQ
jgi:hypothetical protein